MTTMVGTLNLGRHAEANTLSNAAANVRAHENVAKNILLFFAAPFIGLAYILALPVVGTVVVAKLALKALL